MGRKVKKTHTQRLFSHITVKASSEMTNGRTGTSQSQLLYQRAQLNQPTTPTDPLMSPFSPRLN